MNIQDEFLKHTSLPDSKRDQAWESQLFHFLPESKVTLLSDLPQEAPDGFPYLVVESKPDSQEPFHKVINWLSDKGIGLVLNPNKVFPDYIFTYGMIWNFRETGRFLTDAKIQPKKEFSIEPGSKIVAGTPHPQYLPDYVRNLLRQFLLDQGMLRPRILVLGQNDEFDLCFSLEGLSNPPESDRQSLLGAMAWFLPAHYRLALVSEKGLPTFSDL